MERRNTKHWDVIIHANNLFRGQFAFLADARFSRENARNLHAKTKFGSRGPQGDLRTLITSICMRETGIVTSDSTSRSRDWPAPLVATVVYLRDERERCARQQQQAIHPHSAQIRSDNSPANRDRDFSSFKAREGLSLHTVRAKRSQLFFFFFQTLCGLKRTRKKNCRVVICDPRLAQTRTLFRVRDPMEWLV